MDVLAVPHTHAMLERQDGLSWTKAVPPVTLDRISKHQGHILAIHDPTTGQDQLNWKDFSDLLEGWDTQGMEELVIATERTFFCDGGPGDLVCFCSSSFFVCVGASVSLSVEWAMRNLEFLISSWIHF